MRRTTATGREQRRQRRPALIWSRDAVRRFASTGEASNESDSLWLMSRVTGYAPVLEYCGGTEIAGAYIAGCMLQYVVIYWHRQLSECVCVCVCVGRKCRACSAQWRPVSKCCCLTIRVVLLSKARWRWCRHRSGECAVVSWKHEAELWHRLSQRLLHGDHHAVYFDSMPRSPSGQKLRRHGDELRRVRGGYYQALGRCDDAMNLGYEAEASSIGPSPSIIELTIDARGIKVSSLELERACNGVEGVHETAAVAVSLQDGGGPSQLVIFAVLHDASLTSAALLDAFRSAIKLGLNPLFRPHDVIIIDQLPRFVLLASIPSSNTDPVRLATQHVLEQGDAARTTRPIQGRQPQPESESALNEF